MIIFLCGSSGVGKTSIAKILLKKLPDFHFFETDLLIELRPPEKKGDPGTIYLPTVAEKLKPIMNDYKNILIDGFIDCKKEFLLLEDVCAQEPFYFFGITCDIDDVKLRTYTRRDFRPLKFINEHYNSIKSLGFKYDLELNTSQLSSEICAEKIINFIKNQKNPSSFNDTIKKFKPKRRKSPLVSTSF